MATGTSIDIAASPERLWELVTGLGRLDEWVSIHRDFPTPPPSDVAEGTSFAQTLSVAGTPFGVKVDGDRSRGTPAPLVAGRRPGRRHMSEVIVLSVGEGH